MNRTVTNQLGCDTITVMEQLQRVFFLALLVCIVLVTIQRVKLGEPNKNLPSHRRCSDLRVITVIKGGRLGNNIWEYMSLYAVVHLYQGAIQYTAYVPPMLKAKMEYVFERISIPHTVNLPKSCNNTRNPYIVMAQETFPITNSRYIVLEKYSARYQDVILYGVKNIKKELKFHQKYIDRSNNILSKFRKKFMLTEETVTYVGMHYRGTDYVQFLKRTYNTFNGLPNYKYYIKAMSYFAVKFKLVVFVLITLDKLWLEENLPVFQKLNYRLIVNPSIDGSVQDLVLLSLCNHSIISYGTFGSASALFAEGITFAYDLGVPLDSKGSTLAMGISQMLSNWYLLT